MCWILRRKCRAYFYTSNVNDRSFRHFERKEMLDIAHDFISEIVQNTITFTFHPSLNSNASAFVYLMSNKKAQLIDIGQFIRFFSHRFYTILNSGILSKAFLWILTIQSNVVIYDDR